MRRPRRCLDCELYQDRAESSESYVVGLRTRITELETTVIAMLDQRDAIKERLREGLRIAHEESGPEHLVAVVQRELGLEGETHAGSRVSCPACSACSLCLGI